MFDFNKPKIQKIRNTEDLLLSLWREVMVQHSAIHLEESCSHLYLEQQ